VPEKLKENFSWQEDGDQSIKFIVAGAYGKESELVQLCTIDALSAGIIQLNKLKNKRHLLDAVVSF